MRAAVLADVGTLALEERPAPLLRRPDDVLLHVEACGICGTDLHILSRPPGHPADVGVILGHEIVAVVREVGDEVASVQPGDRVVVAPNLACGECDWCRRGLPNHCERFTTYGVFVDGGLASAVVVAARACHPIAPHVPAHLAALAEPLSTVVNGARLAAASPGESAIVLGAGPVGLMFTALLTLAGATVVVVEPGEQRAELARRMGAADVAVPGAAEGGADIVVDAVGTQLPTALDLVRKAGRIVLFGLDEAARAEIAQARITRDELTILGAYVGRDVMPEAVRLLEQGRLELEPMITHRIRLEELPEAVEQLRAGRAAKVVVEFGGRSL
jgi:threonine dehydrogenase-like Zn-dependent dehydrogenase